MTGYTVMFEAIFTKEKYFYKIGYTTMLLSHFYFGTSSLKIGRTVMLQSHFYKGKILQVLHVQPCFKPFLQRNDTSGLLKIGVYSELTPRRRQNAKMSYFPWNEKRAFML